MRVRAPSQFGQSLNTLLGSIAGIIFLVFMGISTCLSYFVAQRSIHDSLAKNASDIATRLAESLARPLWSFDFQTIILVMQGESRSADILWITVKDERGRIQAHVKKLSTGALQSFTHDPGQELDTSAPFPIENRRVLYEGQTIGSVELAVSDAVRQHASVQSIVNSTLTQLVMSLVAIVSIVISVRLFIIRRLARLGETVSDFAKAGFSTRALDTRKDEIGRLAEQFNNMAHTISDYSAHMEELVQDRTTQLVESEKLAFLGSLVAGIAHEINNPVGVCLTATTYLQNRLTEISSAYRKGELSKTRFDHFMEELAHSTTMIVTNLQRTAELVRNFRGIGADQLKDDMRLFNLKEQLNEIVFSLTPRFKATPHTIEVTCPDNILVKSYPSALYQIVSNLVVNSLVHGLDNKKTGTVTLEAKREKETWVLTYSDNGTGISPEILPHIFTLFFTTRHGQGGTGLGLYIVHTLVHKMYGTITCTSELGKGVEFIIRIPIAPPPTMPA